jgi:hypothetical protein
MTGDGKMKLNAVEPPMLDLEDRRMVVVVAKRWRGGTRSN